MPFKTKAARNKHERYRYATDAKYRVKIRRYKAKWSTKWRAAHRSEALAIGRKYDKSRSRNKERRAYMKKYSKNYYRSHRAEQLKKQKERYEHDPRLRKRVKQRAKLWVLNNPRKARQNALLRRHCRIAKQKKALGKPFTRYEWLRKVKSFHWKCLYCHKRLYLKTLEMDHLIPIDRGGKHELDNLGPACRSCNARKSTKTRDEFLKVY